MAWGCIVLTTAGCYWCCCQFSREPDGKMDYDYRVVPARDWLLAGLAFVQECIYIQCSRFTNIECKCNSNPKTSL